VSGIDRGRLCRRAIATVAVVCAAAFAAALPAEGAQTIGQVAPVPQSLSTSCPSNHDYLQPSVTGGHLYVARQAGTITSWSTNVSAAGAQSYTLKIFRRTSDPDVFQVVGEDAPHALAPGLNTFPSNLGVASGDMLGFHVDGGPQNSCVFAMPGDGALRRPGDVTTGQSALFTPVANVRLNLAAVLVPSNAFTITGVSRNRRNGTARLTAQLSNPGVATIGGRGVISRRATTAVARSISLKVATAGTRKRKLARTGSLKVPVTVTFAPTGGDPSSQRVPVKLRMKGNRPAA
jgi:hypothetical protein